MAAQSESVLVLTRNLVFLRDSFGCLPHLQSPVHRGHLGIDEAPTECGVVNSLWSARKSWGGLGHPQRRAGHALHAARDHDVGAARLDLSGRGDGRLHPGSTQPVDRLARHLDGKAREQERHTRDIAVVLARLVGAAEDHVLDLGGLDVRALAGLLEDDRGEVVRPYVFELAAITTHRCARRGDDDRLSPPHLWVYWR